MTAPQLMAAALLIPLLGAAGLLAVGRYPNLREGVSLLAAAALFSCMVMLLPGVAGGERPVLELFQVLPGVSFAFQLEPLGMVFALVVASLWFVTILYATGYMRAHHEQNQTRFYLFFAISIAAAIGGAFSANLLTLYFFYEVLTLATWPLVIHGGTDKDRAGGRTYLMILLGTSLTFLLVALIATYVLAGTLDFSPGGIFGTAAEPLAGVTPLVIAGLFALFLFGTGKAALMPFHRWLPAAMVAPTPVSALLHAVAVVKLGVFTVLKVTVYIFGLDLLTDFNATVLMQYVAAATLLIAAVIAVRQDNIKSRLAYSTVSQLAYIVLAATLANSVAIAAGGMHIVVHAFAKITLFFCAGMILVSLHKTTVTEIHGLGRRMPITFAAWTVASLCVIGFPLSGGFWSKWYLASGALSGGEPLMVAVVLLGSLLAVGYLIPPVVHAFFSAPQAPDHGRDKHAHHEPATFTGEAPAIALVALVVTAVGTVVLFFAAEPIINLLNDMGF